MPEYPIHSDCWCTKISNNSPAAVIKIFLFDFNVLPRKDVVEGRSGFAATPFFLLKKLSDIEVY